MSRGRLIVLEGPDGIGKTRLAMLLAEELTRCGEQAIKLEFPGSHEGSLGALVYRIHHEPASFGVANLAPMALQCLHVAAHVDAIERLIRPTLEDGSSIVLDRFWWSTWVYGLVSGIEEGVLGQLIDFERSCWREIAPQMAFLLDRDAPWREGESGPNWQRLRSAYGRLAEEEGRRHRVEVVSNDGDVATTLDRLTTLSSKNGLTDS